MRPALRRRAWSLPEVPLRRRLLLLAAAGLLPLALMSGLGLLVLAAQQRAQAERAGVEITRALASAVDAELRRSVDVLNVLALSAPVTGDAKSAREFDAQARRVLAAQPGWRAIILADLGGKVWVHTGFAFGSDEAQLAERESFTRALQTRHPVIGHLRSGPHGEFGVPVRVPVLRGGELKAVLTGVLAPQAIVEVISQQRMPADWVVSVFDAHGFRVARSRLHERYLGMAAAPSLQELMASGAAEGHGATRALEGDAVYSAYTRLPGSGWSVAVGVPMSMIDAAGLHSLAAFGGGLLLSLALGGGVALLVARGITRPVAELRGAAQALGRGETPAMPHTELHELREVGEALLASAQQHAQAAAEREALLAAERQARGAAEQARRRLELLARAGTLLSGSLEPQATLRAVASLIAPGIADWCRIDMLDADGVLHRGVTHHADAQKAREGAALAECLHPSSSTPGSMAWAIASGRSRLAHFDTPADVEAIGDEALTRFAQAIGMRAYFLVPLVAHGRTLGALAALQAESGRRFSEDDCALIAQLAQRAALALDNARLYGEAEAARRQAEQANRTKDEFLAMLGHELRNPLAPIVTALHLMERRGDAASTLHERRIIERQVAHLSRLVDDLLDISRVTEGKLQIEHARVDIATVVGRALELTRPLLDARAQPIELQFPDHPLQVTGDAMRLAQVLGNLLSNAAKFTPRDGRIALRVARVDDCVELRVQDSGCGIAPELLPHVFEPFVQGEQRLDRRAGGLGLGLAIVQTLVRLHGGSVRAESAGAGQGSLFVVRLPLTEAALVPSTRPPRTPQRAGPRLRILLVDDNADAAQSLGVLLGEVGHEVHVAGDAPAALASIDAGFVPELALLDIGLPGMDGYELARRLRGDARLRGLRLIALTGYGSSPDRGRSLAAGFDDHLVKPVDVERLLELLQPASDAPAAARA